VAGEVDFTPDEWMTMQRATIAAGVTVAMSEGGGDDLNEEMFALMQALRGASSGHPNQLVRELAGTRFSTGLQPGMTGPEYEAGALEAIRSAVAAVGTKAPADLPAYRVFLVELAEMVANAHKEGGFAGIGGIRVTAAEAAAIDKVRQAVGGG
jgi:hypothetical protein